MEPARKPGGREEPRGGRSQWTIGLAVQASYQSLLAKGSPFDATDIKEHFQGSMQSRTMLLERFDGLIEEMKDHVGIDIKENSLAAYHQTRMQLQQFIRAKYKVSDLTFSQLTEDFIKQFEQYVTGEVGLKQSTCYNMIVFIKKVCKLAYREGAADSLLFGSAHVDKGDSRLPKALDNCFLTVWTRIWKPPAMCFFSPVTPAQPIAI